MMDDKEIPDCRKRGAKLRFLRIHWGFRTMRQLIADARWEKTMGTKFCREDNLGKYERGERCLEMNDLAGIAITFYLPAGVLSDSTSMEDFQKSANLAYEHHKKYAKNFGLTREFDPVISKIELLEKLTLYSEGWEASDYLYSIPENAGKLFKPHTVREISFWGDNLSLVNLSFLLTVAIHYNAGWQQWTLRNAGNKTAVTAMFKILQVTYRQPRLRALYAMQYLGLNELIMAELETQYQKTISDKIRHALVQYLPDKKMILFLKTIAGDNNPYVAEKAGQILSEIASFWDDPENIMSWPL